MVEETNGQKDEKEFALVRKAVDKKLKAQHKKSKQIFRIVLEVETTDEIKAFDIVENVVLSGVEEPRIGMMVCLPFRCIRCGTTINVSKRDIDLCKGCLEELKEREGW